MNLNEKIESGNMPLFAGVMEPESNPDAATIAAFQKTLELLAPLDADTKIATINALKIALHENSPFSGEPVDCVVWRKNSVVHANDYNPNSVAPPEMRLLEISIGSDGYTQPIVTWPNEDRLEVVDGFHRNRVGKESEEIRKRVLGYLPVVVLKSHRHDRGDRMAATIRHNRARGKHRVDSMSEIVVELKRRCWNNEKIGRELGMEPDEVLRLAQITGLASAFADRDFSEAWMAQESAQEDAPGEIKDAD